MRDSIPSKPRVFHSDPEISSCEKTRVLIAFRNMSKNKTSQNLSIQRSERTPGSSTTNVWLVAEDARNCPVAALLPHARGALCVSGMTTI